MKFSEALRQIDISGFERKGTLEEDARRYCKEYTLPDGLKEHLKLRLAFGYTITVHTLTDGVAKRVKMTRLCHVPKETPIFLQSPFIVEARHDNVLFDDISCISGFLENGKLCINTTFRDKNSLIQHLDSVYDGRNIDEIKMIVAGTTSGSFKSKYRFDISEFITIFAIMMEAERTPIAIEEKRKYNKNGEHTKTSRLNKCDPYWIEKRIYIDTYYVPKYNNLAGNHNELDKEGKILKDVYVHGFFRYQPCGPESRSRKWIYVEGFDSTRWARLGHTRIITDIYNK
jgi:hypothetical protein